MLNHSVPCVKWINPTDLMLSSGLLENRGMGAKMGHLSPDLARLLRLIDHVFVSKNVYLLVLVKTMMVINLQSFRANQISWQDKCKHNKKGFVSSTHPLLCPANMYCLISES